MPTYDYKCADCGRIFEKFHGMNETPQVLCPDCSSVNTARQVSLGAGIVFKGAGFYVTDYKKPSSGGSEASTVTKDKPADTTKKEPAATTTSESKSAHSCGPGCSHG
jgi:putative FmdB family regulatory protein